jgi:hypothetical protein
VEGEEGVSVGRDVVMGSIGVVIVGKTFVILGEGVLFRAGTEC